MAPQWSRFKMHVDLGNAAFDDGMLATELGRIVRDVAEAIEEGVDGESIRDVNGNTVGRWDID
jgi:hypothetical protein